MFALAIDHRAQLEKMADEAGAPREKISKFKRLAVQAAARVAAGRPGYGILLDATYGRDALFDSADLKLWIARPVEVPGSRPLRFEKGADIGSRLIEWSVTHTVKCLCLYHPDDAAELRAEQTRTLRGLYDAARRLNRELLIEIISSKHGTLTEDTTAGALDELYAAGIKPDWWKLEPQPSASAWKAIERVVTREDPWCRGVVVLGLEASEKKLKATFAAAAGSPIVKGFAVGRTIFAKAAKAWLTGEIADEQAVDDMANGFRRLIEIWDNARATEAA